MEELQGYLEKYQFRQQQCLYPLLFQDYIYAFAYDHCLNASFFYKSMEFMGYNNKFSSVLVKRLIIRMYQQNYLIHSFNYSNEKKFIGHNEFFYSHFYSQMISEVFGVILELPFSLRFLSSLEEKEIQKFQNLQSIHSIFSFLEDKLSYLNYVFDILIPYPIHLEILVQILQYRIKDVSSFHFLRLFLYEYSNCNNLITSKEFLFYFAKENKRLFRFLYNSYVFECEFLFFFLHKKSFYLRLTSSGTFLERIRFYGKIEHFRIVYHNFFQKTLWILVDPFMHYVRYQGKAILASKGTLLLMKKWKFFLVYFWQYYFYFWSQPHRIHINQFFNNSFNFLGYLSSVFMNHLMIRNQMLENSYLIDICIKKLDTTVPVIPLIRSLSKATFCTFSGHPISKPIWTDLSDYDIIDRFGQICRNLFHYYSGCSKKHTLYRIKYILRFSCARTLARKHKSTVRTFMQRLGSVFLEEFFTEDEQVLSFVFQKKTCFSLHGAHRERIWHLDVVRINDLAPN